MTSTPLHPALVHLPLGLAFILPALALGFGWALWTGRMQPRAWLSIVLLQAVLFAAGLVAFKAGQHEEDRVESVVPESALAAHEERAEQFLWITGFTLAAAVVTLGVSRPRPGAVKALTATTVGSLLVAGAAVRVGHAGGQLVYVHNAAAAYSTGNKAEAQKLQAPAVTSTTKPDVDDDGAK